MPITVCYRTAVISIFVSGIFQNGWSLRNRLWIFFPGIRQLAVICLRIHRQLYGSTCERFDGCRSFFRPCYISRKTIIYRDCKRYLCLISVAVLYHTAISVTIFQILCRNRLCGCRSAYGSSVFTPVILQLQFFLGNHTYFQYRIITGFYVYCCICNILISGINLILRIKTNIEIYRLAVTICILYIAIVIILFCYRRKFQSIRGFTGNRWTTVSSSPRIGYSFRILTAYFYFQFNIITSVDIDWSTARIIPRCPCTEFVIKYYHIECQRLWITISIRHNTIIGSILIDTFYRKLGRLTDHCVSRAAFGPFVRNTLFVVGRSECLHCECFVRCHILSDTQTIHCAFGISIQGIICCYAKHNRLAMPIIITYRTGIGSALGNRQFICIWCSTWPTVMKLSGHCFCRHLKRIITTRLYCHCRTIGLFTFRAGRICIKRIINYDFNTLCYSIAILIRNCTRDRTRYRFRQIFIHKCIGRSGNDSVIRPLILQSFLILGISHHLQFQLIRRLYSSNPVWVRICDFFTIQHQSCRQCAVYRYIKDNRFAVSVRIAYGTTINCLLIYNHLYRSTGLAAHCRAAGPCICDLALIQRIYGYFKRCRIALCCYSNIRFGTVFFTSFRICSKSVIHCHIEIYAFGGFISVCYVTGICTTLTYRKRCSCFLQLLSAIPIGIMITRVPLDRKLTVIQCPLYHLQFRRGLTAQNGHIQYIGILINPVRMSYKLIIRFYIKCQRFAVVKLITDLAVIRTAGLHSRQYQFPWGFLKSNIVSIPFVSKTLIRSSCDHLKCDILSEFYGMINRSDPRFCSRRICIKPILHDHIKRDISGRRAILVIHGTMIYLLFCYIFYRQTAACIRTQIFLLIIAFPKVSHTCKIISAGNHLQFSICTFLYCDRRRSRILILSIRIRLKCIINLHIEIYIFTVAISITHGTVIGTTLGNTVGSLLRSFNNAIPMPFILHLAVIMRFNNNFQLYRITRICINTDITGTWFRSLRICVEFVIYANSKCYFFFIAILVTYQTAIVRRSFNFFQFQGFRGFLFQIHPLPVVRIIFFPLVSNTLICRGCDHLQCCIIPGKNSYILTCCSLIFSFRIRNKTVIHDHIKCDTPGCTILIRNCAIVNLFFADFTYRQALTCFVTQVIVAVIRPFIGDICGILATYCNFQNSFTAHFCCNRCTEGILFLTIRICLEIILKSYIKSNRQAIVVIAIRYYTTIITTCFRSICFSGCIFDRCISVTVQWTHRPLILHLAVFMRGTFYLQFHLRSCIFFYFDISIRRPRNLFFFVIYISLNAEFIIQFYIEI